MNVTMPPFTTADLLLQLLHIGRAGKDASPEAPVRRAPQNFADMVNANLAAQAAGTLAFVQKVRPTPRTKAPPKKERQRNEPDKNASRRRPVF